MIVSQRTRKVTAKKPQLYKRSWFYKVHCFIYGGFMVQDLPGLAPYTAKFTKWTNDPGIAVCICSDGEERLIPSCCLKGFDSKDFPEQDLSDMVIQGIPSRS